MSGVQDFVPCPQCGYAEADLLFNCRSRAEQTLCTRCGFKETWELKHDKDGNHPNWAHEISQGSGVLLSTYRGACHRLPHPEKRNLFDGWGAGLSASGILS